MALSNYDTIIIGAGAAGLSAAGVLAERGKRIAIFDLGSQAGRKVMASGGGRCNITNMAVKFDRYFGQNPDFVRSAICRVTPNVILEWTANHNIKLVEKSAGQYFCQDGAGVVMNALIDDAGDADFIFNTPINEIIKKDGVFIVNGRTAKTVIIATGGISFGALGVSDAGYKIAKDFGHKIIPLRPGLCALSFIGAPTELAGISLDAKLTIGKNTVHDSLLFTHFGIGGPAAYRASLYNINSGINIDFAPGIDVLKLLRDAKQTQGRKNIANILADIFPNRVAKWFANGDNRNIADIKDVDLEKIAKCISGFFIPGDTIKYHGMASAEVVCGGVDTNQVSSKTMESKLCPGLFFAGEVLDVAGDLGGFNLHWAWASGRVAGENA